MRVRTTVGSCREASTQGPKFAKNLDNAENLRKKIGILRHLPSESWNKTYINRKRDPISLINLQSESIFLSSLQSYRGFNFSSHFSSKIFNLDKVMRNTNFSDKKEFFWHLKSLWDPSLPWKCRWDQPCIFIHSKVMCVDSMFRHFRRRAENFENETLLQRMRFGMFSRHI